MTLRRRDALIALVAGVCLVLALLTVFAIELSDTQATSRRDVITRVHERSVLAAALIDSLFQSVEQQAPQYSQTYGGRRISQATMNAHQQLNAYVVVLGPRGRVLASSVGYTPQARAELPSSTAVALARTGLRYGLGNLRPYGTTNVIDLAIPFPTRFGRRILLVGVYPKVLSAFIGVELRKIPGVRGAQNYLVDGSNTVLATANARVPIGARLGAPASLAQPGRQSADSAGLHYDQAALANSRWRVVLAAPAGALFASVSGARKWVPWLIFGAFALVALAALLLGRRLLRSAEEVEQANTRLKQVNDELAATNAILEQRAAELARSNADLDQFASIASHDLQEPLRKVRTFTEQVVVLEADRLSDKGSNYLQRANAAAERMQKLIEDLLKFSRVATHGRPFVPVDLDTLTHLVLEDLEAQVEQSGAIVSVEPLPTISADELQMRQLMQNLISNALKFRREGVVPRVAIDSRVTGEQVELSVRDNGIGFEPQYGGRIFRVFERLHGRNEYSGTGIGLALCRKIAERHGGTVVAEGTPGEGATFTVRLPLHQPGETPPPGEELPTPIPEETHVPA